ncbi:TssN family type VI secretion system protein [Sungkyunkwania multivorans]|uniref:TssN family type VI secretion system protein n=1 Tax=Sungkyunkwania multivorans TaxID=1173618 RepID=A0ABW3D192_9FLAO
MNLFLATTTMSPDFFKIGIILIAISAILMGFVAALKKLFVKNRKKVILWFLVVLLLFALNALLSNDKVLNDIPLNSFIGFQVVFFCFGILHVLAMRKFFPALSEKSPGFWPEFLLTLVTIMIGLISFVAVLDIYEPQYKYVFMVAALWYMIPLMVLKTYEYAVAIPVSIYKKWFYPIDKKMSDPKDEEMQNPLVISFELFKDNAQEDLTNFRLKAPEKMEFGKLFYFFINDYNELHPESKINFLDEANNPNGWIFYSKPSWFRSRKHIDFSRTVESNGIKEDDVVICERA